ncbi:MAG: tetratricopeptide repeat protein [Candidatus Lokiarchaeota archaeon]|nr:tetratricopeptide repeat protein [Candidatus Lokiarchaeota archaeon]
MELVKKLPEDHSALGKIIKKNYQRIDLDKIKVLDETKVVDFYNQVIEEILSSNEEALELIKNLSVLNTEIETNIDSESIKISFKLPNFENIFRELLDTGLMKAKKDKVGIYEFSFPQIQEVLVLFTNEIHQEKALNYYERKIKRFKDDLLDKIEVLYHKAKLIPTEELVTEFLAIANSIEQFDYTHKRLIDIAEELFILEDKYKAPILIVVGTLLSVLGNSETAEKVYLNALELYQNLAKKYYRIYLPYIAATQKNLGTLYIDLKRFEEAEKIYSNALGSYKELEKQYYDAHSPDFHSKDFSGLDNSYLDDMKAYNELLKRFYGIYLPEEPSKKSSFGNVGIDLDLIEDLQDGSIDSIETYKTLAKMSYDMYLIDIAKTQSNLGLVYTELKRFEDAERMHLEALKIEKTIAEHYPEEVYPELVLTLLDLGDLYATLNRFEEAEPRFSEALKISKQLAEKNPEVYAYNVALIQNSLGTVSTRLQKFEDAERLYLGALKILKVYAKNDPKTYNYNVADVQNNLGYLFLSMGNFEKAESYLNKALKKDSTNSEILYNLACLESLRHNTEKALELLKKVIKSDENYIERILQDKKFNNLNVLKEFKELVRK